MKGFIQKGRIGRPASRNDLNNDIVDSPVSFSYDLPPFDHPADLLKSVSL
jgi:hypothetical protein